jgi:hypothetical protein
MQANHPRIMSIASKSSRATSRVIKTQGPDRSEILCLQNSGMILECYSEMTVVVSPKYC